MGALWSFLAVPKNQKTLSWLGAGVLAVAAGLWAVVTYIWSSHDESKIVCAQQGGVAAGRDATGNTVIFNGGNATASGGPAGPCVDLSKPR